MAKKMYVGNLSYDVDADTLTAWFSAYGTVESAHIVTDRETNRSRGYGFVEMSSDEEAQAAIKGLNGSEQNDRAIKVSEANPPKQRSGGGGRRFGGSGGGRSQDHRGGGRPGGNRSGGSGGYRSGGRPGGNRSGGSGGGNRRSY